MFAANDLDEINRIIAEKTQACDAALKAEMDKLGMKHESGDSLKNLKERLYKKLGLINRVSFKFKRSGVFVHKGVGRGTKINQVGSTKRKPEPWFNPIVEKYANEMAEALADKFVELTFKNLKIK